MRAAVYDGTVQLVLPVSSCPEMDSGYVTLDQRKTPDINLPGSADSVVWMHLDYTQQMSRTPDAVKWPVPLTSVKDQGLLLRVNVRKEEAQSF